MYSPLQTKSFFCTSGTLRPLIWAGAMHWVKGAKPRLALSQSESQDRWQSQWRLLECRRLRRRSEGNINFELNPGLRCFFFFFYKILTVTSTGTCTFTHRDIQCNILGSHFPKVCDNMTASTERTHTQRNLYLFREPESQTGQRGTRGVDGEDTKTETESRGE